jgi:hypothetical protein
VPDADGLPLERELQMVETCSDNSVGFLPSHHELQDSSRILGFQSFLASTQEADFSQKQLSRLQGFLNSPIQSIVVLLTIDRS